MPEITVKIPDGDYCEGCPFMNEYTHNLIDIMGNETGHTMSGVKCNRFNEELEVENEGCFTRIKKCDCCKMTDEERMQRAATYLLLFKMLEKDQADRQNQESMQVIWYLSLEA